jgi:hypothetical protein
MDLLELECANQCKSIHELLGRTEVCTRTRLCLFTNAQTSCQFPSKRRLDDENRDEPTVINALRQLSFLSSRLRSDRVTDAYLEACQAVCGHSLENMQQVNEYAGHWHTGTRV